MPLIHGGVRLGEWQCRPDAEAYGIHKARCGPRFSLSYPLFLP